MDKIGELFAKLAEQYGPSVIEAAKQATRIEAYSHLVGSLIATLFGFLMFRGGQYLVAMKCEDNTDDGLVHAVGYLLLGLSLIPIAIAIWAWIDPWTWVAINHPELWIAKKILKL